MAITINGSGTISGISAGGLPDGSVTAADLASGAITSGALPSGSVLQVVQGINSTYASTSSSTYADVGMAQSITPSSSSSKILILISASLANTSSSTNNNVRILRNATEIEEFSRVSFCSAAHVNAQNFFAYLDSPSTTSATTYKLQYKTDGGTFRFNDFSGGSPQSSITLMEIAG